jgi:NAD(P)-dependent dehydrogenase (short-subunit alcohol dehydrogenase family)
VTGANRGLGKALVEEALRRDAKRVYAGARQSFAHADMRVTPLTLDVTSWGKSMLSISSSTMLKCRKLEQRLRQQG